MDERTNGREFKEAVKITLKVIKKMVNQIDDDYLLDGDYEQEFWNDFKSVADDVSVIYGYQELNKKIK